MNDSLIHPLEINAYITRSRPGLRHYNSFSASGAAVFSVYVEVKSRHFQIPTVCRAFSKPPLSLLSVDGSPSRGNKAAISGFS